MSTVKYQSVCIYCGKGGSSMSISESLGQPHSNPSSIGGKCPSSPDGKHKPKWVKV